ncbi:unnamed protein product [Calypogeia fissa]
MGSMFEDRDNNHNGKAAAAHVLVVPVSTQGHITPMLRFATQLAREGITITFVGFQDAIDQLNSGKDGSASELQGLDFRFVGLKMPENKSMLVGVASNLPAIGAHLREAFKPFGEQLIRDKSAGLGGPTSVLSDVVLFWTQDLAETLEIPRYMFHASGITFARAMQGFSEKVESGELHFSEGQGSKLDYFDGQVYISGLPPLRYHELPRSFRVFPHETRTRCESMERAAGLVVNSIFELEEKVINAWRHTVDASKVPKFYTTGPLFSATATLPNVRVRQELEDSDAKCLQFLDSQAPSSVLYVAFGTHCCLSPDQIRELAMGLEKSEQSFLWVIPQRKDHNSEMQTLSLEELLPPRFEERLGGKCCIVTGWVPQLQILAHKSTGGFLSHVGWNSTLESVILGMPLIACPQGAEQHLNCRYLVDELKIAVELATGPQFIFEHNKVERAVRLLMVESEGKEIRSRVEALQRKAAGAMAEGGSKSRSFQQFLHDIRIHNLSPQPRRKL